MIDIEAAYQDFIKGMTIRVSDEKQTRMFFFGVLALGMKLAVESNSDFDVADALDQIRSMQQSGWVAP